MATSSVSTPNRWPIRPRCLPGELYLDGEILCTPDESGVRGRRRLSFGGMVALSLCINGRGEMVSGPDMFIEGLPQLDDPDEEPLEKVVRQIVRGVFRSLPGNRRTDPGSLGETIRRAVRGELNAYWGKKPNVTVFVHKV